MQEVVDTNGEDAVLAPTQRMNNLCLAQERCYLVQTPAYYEEIFATNGYELVQGEENQPKEEAHYMYAPHGLPLAVQGTFYTLKKEE